MWAGERQQRILALLASQGSLSTERLARELRVSRETVRRDILTLEEAGRLQRFHGGVLPAGAPPEAPFATRRATRAAEKARIAEAAAALVRPGACCLIETGTTTTAFAAALLSLPDVSVITNSLEVAGLFQDRPAEAGALLLGGRVAAEVPGTFGEIAIEMLSQFSADLAVVSPVALSPEEGAMNHHPREAALGRAMIARAARVLMLADSGKLGRTSRVLLAPCARIDILVTDAGADPALLDALRQAGIGQIIVA